jgi:hypothetical protein
MHSDMSLEPMEERLFLGGGPIVFAYILLQPKYSELALFLAQPLRGAREIWQDPERRAGYNDGYDALENKDPPPCAQTMRSVHVACNPSRNETTERS